MSTTPPIFSAQCAINLAFFFITRILCGSRTPTARPRNCQRNFRPCSVAGIFQTWTSTYLNSGLTLNSAKSAEKPGASICNTISSRTKAEAQSQQARANCPARASSSEETRHPDFSNRRNSARVCEPTTDARNFAAGARSGGDGPQDGSRDAEGQTRACAHPSAAGGQRKRRGRAVARLRLRDSG